MGHSHATIAHYDQMLKETEDTLAAMPEEDRAAIWAGLELMGVALDAERRPTHYAIPERFLAIIQPLAATGMFLLDERRKDRERSE